MRKFLNKLYWRYDCTLNLTTYQIWAGAHGIVGFQGKRVSFGWDHALIVCGKLGFWFTVEKE